MKKDQKYMDRAMKSRDPRYVNILHKLGYERRDMVAEKPVTVVQPVVVQPVVEPTPVLPQQPVETDDLATLRAKYKEVMGKTPYYGWDVETLRERIAKGK